MVLWFLGFKHRKLKNSLKHDYTNLRSALYDITEVKLGGRR